MGHKSLDLSIGKYLVEMLNRVPVHPANMASVDILCVDRFTVNVVNFIHKENSIRKPLNIVLLVNDGMVVMIEVMIEEVVVENIESE